MTIPPHEPRPEPDPRPGSDTSRPGREPFWKRSDWNLRQPSAIVPLLGALFVLIAAIVIVVFVIRTPSAAGLGQSRLAEATSVYTADGKLLTRYYQENRRWVSLDSISPNVVHALIDTEDERFYQHHGIDVMRTVGAAFKTARGNVQGGSTITMQLVRNIYPDIADDPDLIRKFKEWIMAIKLEDRYSKDEILEMYLNTVPFLYNAFGIDAGARTYFGKPAIDLNVIEAATLVGMLKGPTLYNPARNPKISHERRNTVLRQMVKYGDLPEQKYRTLAAQPTPLRFSPITPENNLAPYFAEYVRNWLKDWAKDRGIDIYTNGLRVYTTLDSKMQQAAEEAVKKEGQFLQDVVNKSWGGSGEDRLAGFWRRNPSVLDRLVRNDDPYRQLVDQGVDGDEALAKLKDDQTYLDSLKNAMGRLEAGFIAINPNNGFIKAWVGGRDYSVDKYDHVFLAKRQVGSTFKPFVYGTALALGYSENYALPDVQMQYVNRETGQVWSPGNFEGEGGDGRMLTLKQGLAYSVNTVTAQLIMRVGPKRVAAFAHRAGITSHLDAVPSLALGTSSLSLYEMASAYTTFAENGVHHEPIAVTRIEDSKGQVLATFGPQGEQVIPPRVAYGTLDMLRGVVDFGTGVRIRNQYHLRGALAGKTGTTQNAADGWFMLIHPDLVMGAWVGFSSPLVTFRTAYWGQGAHNALRVVGEFAQHVDLPEDAVFKRPTSGGNDYDLFADNGFDDGEGEALGDRDSPWSNLTREMAARRLHERMKQDPVHVPGMGVQPITPGDRDDSDDRADRVRGWNGAANRDRDVAPEPSRNDEVAEASRDDGQQPDVAKLNRRERKKSNLDDVLKDLHQQEQKQQQQKRQDQQKQPKGW
ncbi:MAG TPA: transglycosylase domain-containing protein [Rhodothermales bacterium]|nr:transglycosylase domain-containing protein [Rhodothermales bacterium]